MKAARDFQLERNLLKLNGLEGVAHMNAGHGPGQEAELPGAKVSVLKRMLDISCLIIAIPTLVPLMLGIAALIKIVSPGPVFFM